MNRKAFIRLLVRQGCCLYRHGARHDIYLNPRNGHKAPVPRHVEIKNTLAQLIRKQLDIE